MNLFKGVKWDNHLSLFVLQGKEARSAWKLEAEIEAVRAASPAHPEEIELVTLTQSNVVNRTGATAPDWQTGEEAAALAAVRLHALGLQQTHFISV